MKQSTIHGIAEKVNSTAPSYSIGRHQEIRTKLHGLKRRPGRKIFTQQTTTTQWAFHHGGRKELQFNIGFDGSDGKQLRYGVAFSFEKSQTLPSIDVLAKKVPHFNRFLELNPNMYADMRMWHWRDDARGSESTPGPIPAELVAEGVFVFLGARKSVERLECAEILDYFDRLLPLYRYVESKGRERPSTTTAGRSRPGRRSILSTAH